MFRQQLAALVQYCVLLQEELVGHTLWFPYCCRSVLLRESVLGRDVQYRLLHLLWMGGVPLTIWKREEGVLDSLECWCWRWHTVLVPWPSPVIFLSWESSWQLLSFCFIRRLTIGLHGQESFSKGHCAVLTSGVLTFKWLTFLVLAHTWYFHFYFTCLAGCLRVHACTMCMPHGL